MRLLPSFRSVSFAPSRTFAHSPQLQTKRGIKDQAIWRSGFSSNGADVDCPKGGKTPQRSRRETMIGKIALAIALTVSVLASVPALARPHHNQQMPSNCQEDLGYGRTSGWGCG
jgi:hypothetical protein